MARETKLDREIERYRQAVTVTLEHLEWCVGYLRQLQKPELARALERNRKQILESIRR
jgi:hypothetical protein